MRYSRRTVRAVCAFWIFATSFAAAAAADTIEYVVKKQDGTWTCFLKSGPADEGEDFTIRVFPEGALLGTQFDLSALGAGSTKIPLTALPPDVMLAVTLQPNALPANTTIQNVEVAGTVQEPQATASSPVNCLKAPPLTAPLTAPQNGPEETAALEWWNTDDGRKALKQFEDERGDRFPRRTVFLVHLPTGAAASPFPESVSEDDYLQVLVIQRPNSVPYLLKVATCQKRSSFRVLGAADDFKDLIKPQGEGIGFVLLPAGRPFRCGPEEVVYHPERPAPEKPGTTPPADTHLRVRPVYQVATTFTYGFDFAKQDSFSIQSSKIAKTTDYVGPGLRIGFTWFPSGLDPEKMRWWNRVFNPFAVFDPKAPTENFIVGNSFTWRGGVSLAVGAAIHKNTILQGVVVGQEVDADVTVAPTAKQWRDINPGLFVGVALDSTAYKALKDFLK
ncbi:MAG: hypothetical protein ACRDHY_06670 [Anaerolineales bacterium]